MSESPASRLRLQARLARTDGRLEFAEVLETILALYEGLHRPAHELSQEAIERAIGAMVRGVSLYTEGLIAASWAAQARRMAAILSGTGMLAALAIFWAGWFAHR